MLIRSDIFLDILLDNLQDAAGAVRAEAETATMGGGELRPGWLLPWQWLSPLPEFHALGFYFFNIFIRLWKLIYICYNQELVCYTSNYPPPLPT